ncbi:MAG: YncE family protein [Deltaproteobacteria bacterium]|jgi:DNA-binding beta-propeller fold protein YncE|nr:YncE family protein [Deltaproteobacteria bacterium]
MGRRTLGILVALVATACVPLPPAYESVSRTDGLLRIYLQPLPQEAHRLRFSITEILALREDGGAVRLRQNFSELHGEDLVGLQRLLVSAALPPGSYTGISLQLGAASLLGEAGRTDLLAPEEPLLIEQDFRVVRQVSSTLFLSLDPEELVSSGFRFTPLFYLAKSRRQLESLLGFATNTGGNVVSVFNKHTMEIVETIATGSGPMGAALDQRRKWVYVALAGDAEIAAIDVGTTQILQRIRLNFGDEPVEVGLSPDGEFLVSANRGSNTASIMDTGSLRELDRVRLPSEPGSVVMSTVEPRAFLLQPLANTISIVDFDQRRVVLSQTLEESPLRGAVNEDGTSLFVISENSPNLLVIDPRNLRVTERIFVGRGATSIELDPKTGLIYIGMRMGGVAVVDPSLLMPIDTFRVDGNAVALDIDGDENNLFVVSSNQRTIRKLGLVSQKLIGTIEVEEGCYAVVLMGGR